VVATTHSPLIVGSMEPNEIWLFQRAPLKSALYGVVQLGAPQDGIRDIVVLGPEPEPEEDGSVERPQRRYRVLETTSLAVKDEEIVEIGSPLTVAEILAAQRIGVQPEGQRADQILTSPLFNLESTRDKRTTDLISEYTRLNAIDDPDESERENLAETAKELRIRVANPEEREAARTAYELIQDFAKDRLQTLPPEEQQKVLDEVKAQLTEAITGSRRPQ
jgi:hypothetical protein